MSASSRHLQLTNSGPFLIVTDADTGVQVRINKTNLLVQKDNDDTFFLKNDSYIAYYNYSDFVSPQTDNITGLLDIITLWSASLDINLIGVASKSDSGAVAAVTTGNVWRISHKDIASGGSNFIISPSVDADGPTGLQLDGSPLSRAVRQNVPCCPYTFGATFTAIVSGTLAIDGNTSNAVARIGVFDDVRDIQPPGDVTAGNGMFFQCDGVDSLSIVYRFSDDDAQNDIAIPQNEWNVDKMNGKGSSGIVLDPLTKQNYVFQWSKHGARTAGVLNPNTGSAVVCHAFLSETPVFRNASLPVRWEMFSGDSNAADAQMSQGAAVITSDLPFASNSSRSFSVGNAPMKQSNTTGDVLHIFSLRVRPERVKSMFRITSARILNSAQGGMASWEIVRNAQVDGAEFSGVQDSDVEMDTTATSCSGGVVVASGFIVGASQEDACSNLSLDWTSSSFVDGTPDVLSLRVTLLAGVISVSAAVSWQEL